MDGRDTRIATELAGLVNESTGNRSVSVIIPSRNGFETIRRALDSLVDSADYICDVFVVLSNSSVEYAEFCEKLPQEYAHHFKLLILDSGQRSTGSIARNAPLSTLNGQFVAYLDDDDEWFNGKLAKYFAYMRSQNVSGDFVLFSTVLACNEDKSDQRLMPTRAYKGESIAEFILSFGGGAQTSSIMLPASLARRSPFETTWPRHQDYDFCIGLAEKGARFYHLLEPTSYWYQRGNNSAKGGTIEFCIEWLNAHRSRLSHRAYSAYVGKELFAAARSGNNWRRFWKFFATDLSLMEQADVMSGLVGRSVALAFRKVFQKGNSTSLADSS